VGAAIVLRGDFDVPVFQPAIQLVLDTQVGDVDLVVGLYATLPISRTYLTASLLFVRSIPSKVNR
jgi:hypothetical protein